MRQKYLIFDYSKWWQIRSKYLIFDYSKWWQIRPKYLIFDYSKWWQVRPKYLILDYSKWSQIKCAPSLNLSVIKSFLAENWKPCEISINMCQNKLDKVKWFQELLCITYKSIKYQLFVCTQLNDQTVLLKWSNNSI